jgi:hypothetical protein
MTSSKEPTTSTRTITLNDETVQDTRQQELAHGELTSPWSIAPLETPQEELETEEVGLFKELEDLRDLPYEQQRQEYIDMLPRQADPALAAATPIMDYLKTEVSYKVFVYNPNEWTGIIGIEPVELKFREDMPERMPSKARPIPAKLIEHAKPEFDKLCEYYLTPCTSPCTSPMVIAPKATAPFVRIYGDFRRINTYIVAQSDHISAVRKEIEKARNFSLFTDADIRASFHQIPLPEYSSQRLAIQTVWGTFRPRFVPEGTSPASFYLQKIVQGIFEDFSDWMIVIIDNLLILGNTYEEIYDKTTKVIDRCYERNVKLKMSKCWLGVKKVSFFG